MARYRIVEITDTLINDGEPFWRLEKQNFFGFWTEYFEEHLDQGAAFYDYDEVVKWYEYHVKGIRRTIMIIMDSKDEQ